MMYVKFPITTKHMFFRLPGKKGDSFGFSTELDKIGVEWDVSIRNGTYVEVISDPIEIEKQPYGKMSVIKIRADVATDYHTIIKEFYVPTICIVEVKDNAINSTELPN